MRLWMACALLFVATLARADQGAGEMHIRQIEEGVYLHTSYKKLPGIGYYPSNGLVVIVGSDAYIVDTPWRIEDTGKLLQWIEGGGYRTAASISTHFHEDRSSGIAYLNEIGVDTWASERTNQLLAEHGRAQARHSFHGRELSLLNGEIVAWYPGGGHTEDNIVVWLPGANVLAGGCLVRSVDTDGAGNTADAVMADWAESVMKTYSQFPSARIVIPGHGEPGGRELLLHTRKILEVTLNVGAPAKL